MDVLAEEGRARPRKASGSCQEALIRRCPNGETPSDASLRYRVTQGIS